MNRRVFSSAFAAAAVALALLCLAHRADAQSASPSPAPTASASPASVTGTPQERTDALIARGVELRRHSDDEGALEQFRQAYEIMHDARARAQMGLAELALGHWVRADAYLREALATTTHIWVEHNRPTLQAMVDRAGQHVGSLDIRGGVPGAEVWFNGERVATLPLSQPVRVLAGSFPVEVRASGYHTVVVPIEIPPSGLARTSVTLVATGQTEQTAATASATPAASSPAPAAAHSEGGGISAPGAAPLALMLGGVVALGLGGLFYGLWTIPSGQLNAQTGCNTTTWHCPSSASGLVNDANLYNVLMDVAFGVGAVAIVAGVVLWATAPKDHHEHVSASITPLPGGMMFGIGGAL